MAQSQSATAKRFRPATFVRWAKLRAKQPAFIKRKRSRGRFAVGVRYERQVRDYLSLLALGKEGVECRESQWFEFEDSNGRRWCECDFLLIDRKQKTAIIYEVKYQHCMEAWWQLRELYYPVVQAAFPGYTIGLMEVVHWHDPAITFPQGYDLTDSPLRIPRSSKVAVFIYNPKRSRLPSGLATTGRDGGEGVSQTPSRGGLQERPNGLDGTSSAPRGAVVHGGSGEVPQGAEGEAISTRSRTEIGD